MIFAGVDVGAATAKAVIFCDNSVSGYAVIPTGHDVKLAAEQAVQQAIKRAGISSPIGKLDYVISTGYARNAVAFADKSTTEIICHAKGANFIFPEVRTIIDIGGQDSKAIEVDDEGNVRDFIMNDKCAAGTGRFLEVMAGVLQAGSVDNMGPLSLKSEDPCQISSTCTIFAESEVVSLRAEGRSREDLIAGVHDSIASRVTNMSRRLNIKPMLVFTGGVAKNAGVKKSLEAKFGISIAVPEEPQIIGALGAALFAAAAAGQIQEERKGA
jgi:predicted CoA-substrate-specific enzyme activase